jgi:hypothetical protein
MANSVQGRTDSDSSDEDIGGLDGANDVVLPSERGSICLPCTHKIAKNPLLQCTFPKDDQVEAGAMRKSTSRLGRSDVANISSFYFGSMQLLQQTEQDYR